MRNPHIKNTNFFLSKQQPKKKNQSNCMIVIANKITKKAFADLKRKKKKGRKNYLIEWIER